MSLNSLFAGVPHEATLTSQSKTNTLLKKPVQVHFGKPINIFSLNASVFKFSPFPALQMIDLNLSHNWFQCLAGVPRGATLIFLKLRTDRLLRKTGI